jgi:hypothetical protein
MAEGERASHLAILENWKLRMPPEVALAVHRFGSGLPTAALPVKDHPPVDLELAIGEKVHTVRLEGVSDPVGGSQFLLLTNREVTNLSKQPTPADADQRQLLRSWLSHLLLCAQGDGQERQACLLAVSKKQLAVVETTLPALAPQKAREQLTEWLTEIFSENPPRRLMPIEALLSKKPVTDLREFIDRYDEGEDMPKLVCFKGPIPRVQDLEVEPNLDAGQRRLARFLAIASAWRVL